jgi:hypothetical protein
LEVATAVPVDGDALHVLVDRQLEDLPHVVGGRLVREVDGLADRRVAVALERGLPAA